ncbi:hypothetical protein MPC4_270008 [Methylocella tundrae]|uniref:Uncharacterized protein n=1 Tax=Methylocella tundrae TaxID=227605 RepID=A0A8B6M773_METTU|nr:hypothetical protein MPC1_1090006 [Methylocella tundrae]VTZ50647.1 hypothetical protein MPC4_270008 [Methylocella tundrae]
MRSAKWVSNYRAVLRSMAEWS